MSPENWNTIAEGIKWFLILAGIALICFAEARRSK